MALLRELVREGARWRYGGEPPEDVARQLARELDARRAARVRELLPHGLGRRPLRALARHPLPGARQRRELRRLLRPRHHRHRSRADGAPLRAVHLRRAGRAARHRRRLRARAARGGAPVRLRAVRPRPRRDGLRGHHLPREVRAARRGQGARALARAGGPAREAGRDVRGPRRQLGPELLAAGGARRRRLGARPPDARARARAAGVPAPPLDPRRRVRHHAPAALRDRADRARRDAGADHRPVGQGRSRRARSAQGRPARARDADRALARARAPRPPPAGAGARRPPVAASRLARDHPGGGSRPSTTCSRRRTRSACSRSSRARRCRSRRGSSRGTSTTSSSRWGSCAPGRSRAG